MLGKHRVNSLHWQTTGGGVGKVEAIKGEKGLFADSSRTNVNVHFPVRHGSSMGAESNRWL